MNQHFLTTLLLVFLAAMLPACGPDNPTELVLSGTIEAESVHAGSRIGGRVAEIFVDEGDRVGQDDILFSIETDVLDAELDRAKALVNEAEAAFNTLAAGAKPEDITRARQEASALHHLYTLASEGPLPEEISVLEEQANSLGVVWENTDDAADRIEYLFNEGVAAEREYINARLAEEAAKNQWDSSLEQIEVLKSYPREAEVDAAYARYLAASSAVRSLESGATPEQLDQALARIETATESVERIEIDILEATVIAPSDGMISSFDIKPGDFVAPGQRSCEIIEMDNLKVVVYIPENRLGFITEGESLDLTVDSFPGENFSGTVMHVAAEAEFTPRNVQTVEERVAQVFAVEISVSNSDNRLRPGMAADVVVSLVD